MSLQDEFEKLTAGIIGGFPAAAQEEHLQLDFKLVNDPNLGGQADRRILAKCISGFANSSGGIVVWGVDARRNNEGIDCAGEVQPMNSLGIFLSRLNELSGRATSPAVEGVIHKKFETSPNQGFAATLIPESSSGPHMAKFGDNRYYKRNGQEFLQMEHFELEDMFGRRQKPNLEIIASSKRSPGNLEQEEVEFKLLSIGRAVARHVGLFASVDGATIISTHRFENVSGLNEGRQMFSYENNVNVFHPNGIYTNLGKVIFARTNPEENVAIFVSYYCEHMRYKTKTFTFAPLPPLPLPEPIAET